MKFESILLLQFHDKFEIRAGQIILYPLVDALVQFRTEMIFPIACLS